MKLAIVIPIFNEEATLPVLIERLTRACESVPDAQWTVLCVDDGSADRSVALLAEQHERDPRFGYVRLSRNFGHQAAIAAGLAHADGDAIVVMDGDLQDPPELIPQMVAAWRDGGQVVRAVRTRRPEVGVRGVGLKLFHWLFEKLCKLPNVGNTGVFALMDRRAADALRQLPERSRFLPGLRSWVGFDQRTVTFEREARAEGQPRQSLPRLIKYALDAFFSFTYQPLRWMTYAGLFVSATAFLIAVAFIIRRLTGAEIAVTGFTTLVTLVLFMGGIQLIAMGVLGEYIGRIFEEVKQRPLYIVGDATSLPRAAAGPASDPA